MSASGSVRIADHTARTPRDRLLQVEGIRDAESKMMWNYFADTLARLRAWPRLAVGPGASDPEMLAAAFPLLSDIGCSRVTVAYE